MAGTFQNRYNIFRKFFDPLEMSLASIRKNLLVRLESKSMCAPSDLIFCFFVCVFLICLPDR